MGCSSGRLPSAPLDPECPEPDPESPDPDPDPDLNPDPGPNPDPDPDPDLSTLERLAQATGGTEKSWYRCVFPFGVISLVIGLAGSGVTFSFNTLAQTQVLSLVLLVLGLVLLLTAAICWRIHRSRRREEKEAGIFSSEMGQL